MGWRPRTAVGVHAIEKRFDEFRFSLKQRFGLLDPFEIMPYRGHGTPHKLFLKGRVLEERGITSSGQYDTVWDNLRNMARRFASDEVPGARVRASFGRLTAEAVADEEGFFDVGFDLLEPLTGSGGWYPIELELLHPRSPGGGPVLFTGRVLVPGGARFGIISDIDDTVVRSSATNVMKMARIVLLNNAHTRLPFEGVGAFYEALRRGPDEQAENPIFYVSSSPWNIYDVLQDFLDVHGVPEGPLFLKDWSPSVLGKHRGHKLGIIRKLLSTYPNLPFVLIGDSGEEDPEIYSQVVREYPGRVLAVYIRDVTSAERDAEVKTIAREMRNVGVELVPVPDSATAAEHAASAGLISPGALPDIRAQSSTTARDRFSRSAR
jgi:phosphatidate phosphatase APP1